MSHLKNQEINVNNDLFDNPMVRAAMKSMSQEEKDNYKRIGQKLYNIDFTQQLEDNKDLGSLITEAQAYVETQLRSGMHPSMLEETEKQVMENVKGPEWYKEWGYTKEDLTEIITTKF